MPYLRPLSRSELGGLEPMFEPHERRLGFVPNGFLISARNPQILQAYQPYTAYSLTGGSLPLGQKLLCAMVAAAENGCVYCQTHLARGLEAAGIPVKKMLAALVNPQSPALEPSERAALDFVRAASQQPNTLRDSDCTALIDCYTPAERAQIVSLVCQFQYLSRVNGMMGSEIEPHAYDYAVEHLTPTGWAPGVHAPGAPLVPSGQDDRASRMDARRAMSGVDQSRTLALWPLVADTLDADIESAYALFRDLHGFVPNLARSMSIDPALAKPIARMSYVVATATQLDAKLQSLVRGIASLANGSRYGQALNAAHAQRLGIAPAKIAALWSFESSALYTQAEKAALRFACAGALQPQDVAESDHRSLSEHYSERQVVDLIFTIAWQACLDRWADICAVPVDAEVVSVASELLGPSGWRAPQAVGT